MKERLAPKRTRLGHYLKNWSENVGTKWNVSMLVVLTVESAILCAIQRLKEEMEGETALVVTEKLF